MHALDSFFFGRTPKLKTYNIRFLAGFLGRIYVFHYPMSKEWKVVKRYQQHVYCPYSQNL